jgi:membrane associated rhomboid family serine protease
MYRPRRTRDLRDALTFGGRIPAAVGGLLVAMGVASIAAWISPERVLGYGALLSGAPLQVWRLVTYALFELQPINLVFALLMIYSFGPPLIYDQGERRFLGSVLAITVGAGLVTLGLGWALGLRVVYFGIWPLVTALTLLWALRYPEQQILLMFVLPVTGRVMALITVGITAAVTLYAFIKGGLGGLVEYAPLATAVALAWVLAGARIGLPRRWKLRWREWWLERQLRRRSRHLQVVKKDGQGGPKQWMN